MNLMCFSSFHCPEFIFPCWSSFICWPGQWQFPWWPVGVVILRSGIVSLFINARRRTKGKQHQSKATLWRWNSFLPFSLCGCERETLSPSSSSRVMLKSAKETSWHSLPTPNNEAAAAAAAVTASAARQRGNETRSRRWLTARGLIFHTAKCFQGFQPTAVELQEASDAVQRWKRTCSFFYSVHHNCWTHAATQWLAGGLSHQSTGGKEKY